MEDTSPCPAPGAPTLFFNFARRCDIFLPTSIQNSLQISAVLCLCFSPSILSLVPNSCGICTTKCLCAGAEQWWMQTAGWPAGTSPALLLMNYSFSTLIAFNVSPNLSSHLLLFNLWYFLWTVWPTKSTAKLPKITQHTLMTEDRCQPPGPLFSKWWLLIIWGGVNEGSTHSCYNLLFF